ncbi:MAG: SH3 domain-containing protein [Dehalococcoidia bacterium]
MPTSTPPRGRRLPSILVSALALLLVGAALGTARAAAAGTSGAGDAPVTVTPLESSNPIASAALAYLGNYEGQCFPWVRRVVEQATGRTIGFDYRQGYLEAGAVEVTLDEARAGDIIQLASDANTSSLADYAGLHTSIVFANYGGGRFDVIDSNSQWLGVVRLRTDYDPMESAARYPGINVHVYRFPQANTTAPAAAPAPTDPAPDTPIQLSVPANPGGATEAFQATQTATVDAGGDCLNMRSAASLTGGILTCIPDGSTVSVLPSQQTVDGITWQLVAYNGLSGWVSNEFLQLSSTPTPTATATTSPTATASATPSVTVTATPTSSATPTAGAPVPSDSGIIGDLPQGGGLGLIVYGGGTIENLVASSNARGCSPVSVWANRSGGGLIGVIPGAPALVNREWTAQFGGGPIPAASPLIIVCRGASSATPPPSSGTTAPSSGGSNGPPGPAGNE